MRRDIEVKPATLAPPLIPAVFRKSVNLPGKRKLLWARIID
jgi:hypothetical protein